MGRASARGFRRDGMYSGLLLEEPVPDTWSHRSVVLKTLL